MKKITTLLLALLMALSMAATPAGLAESAESTESTESNGTWEEGLSASQPYPGVPAVDLTTQMGYMMFYPNTQMQATKQCRKLYVYLPREDAEAGEGVLYLCSEAKGVVWSTPMNDETYVQKRAISADELEALVWGGGTCFEVTLPKSLEMGVDYFVNMESGAIVTPYEGVVSRSVGGTEDWAFTVGGDYGVNGLEYLHSEEEGGEETEVTQPTKGDKIRFDLVLGGEATMAVLYGYYNSVDFLPNVYEESGEVVGEVTGDYPVWGIMFLDAEGNELDHVDF